MFKVLFATNDFLNKDFPSKDFPFTNTVTERAEITVAQT